MAMGIILRFDHRGSRSHGFMKLRLVTRGVASGLLLTGGQTGTLTFQPLIACHICLIFLDGLIHLLRGQLAPILVTLESRTCLISSWTPFKETSYWMDQSSFSVSSSFQSLPKLLTEVPTLIKRSMAAS